MNSKHSKLGWITMGSEIKKILKEIDDETLEKASESKKKLILFLKKEFGVK